MAVEGKFSRNKSSQNFLLERQSSNPSFLTLYPEHNLVLFAAEGFDTLLRMKEEFRDHCDGMRRSTFNPRIVYVVPHNDLMKKQQVCPKGFFLCAKSNISAHRNMIVLQVIRGCQRSKRVSTWVKVDWSQIAGSRLWPISISADGMDISGEELHGANFYFQTQRYVIQTYLGVDAQFTSLNSLLVLSRTQEV